MLRHAHRFEYRNGQGHDQLAAVDVWAASSGQRALLVLRDVPSNQAPHALHALHADHLCYLLRPEASVQVMTLGCQSGNPTRQPRLLVGSPARDGVHVGMPLYSCDVYRWHPAAWVSLRITPG
ncbi:hypothetical protein ACFSC4_17720 [Deinococcus malanensis]|uniref:hypothetical protein n=1 Tax=Deinococcus malanensis TaxID=1706855 RepID=UPI0036455BC6